MMPSEAFGWILAALDHSIFPSGLGGFRPESRASIVEALNATKELLESGEDV